jgi:serine/threonine protein kinase
MLVNDVPYIVAGPGLRVGEYVLDQKIGQGAFGEVWRARHRAWTDQFAAAKIPTDPAFLRQLQSEGFSLHRLAHPNIVKVIGFDPAASPPYLMTELVNGPSLRELLKRGPLPLAQAIAIFRQILAGLSYAHQHGVVHGDMKPENVLVDQEAIAAGLTAEGSVKLADFGVGLVTVAAALGTSSSRILHGRSGPVATLAYVAPEQREGGAPDAKCDLYSCGVMLFELLTGERPAGAESPGDLNPEVPRVLDDIFRRAYARRDRRYATAQEFLAAIEGVAAALPAVSQVERPAPRAAEPARMAAPPAVGGSEDDVIGLRPDDGDGQAFSIGDPHARTGPVERPPHAEPRAPEPPPTRAEPPAPRAAEPPAAPPPEEPAPRPVKTHRNVVVMDELARRPLKTADELRNSFQRVHLTRQLDQGEIANLRMRLDQWAESVGGIPGFGERIEVTEALDCPYHRVVVSTRFDSAAGPGNADTTEQAIILANSSASQDCGQILEANDFVPFVHLSTGVFPSAILEMITIPVIRMTLGNLLAAAKTQAAGRKIIRQDLILSRATVLSMRYLFDNGEHGVCFAGTSLKVVAPVAPLTRLRDELLRRAAMLLDSENIGAGITELRQMFLTPNPAQPRAEKMLIAMRAKLSAAYIALARATAANMGLFESLTYSSHAADLLPGSEAAEEHERRIRKQSFWIHGCPGLVIGLIFALIAAFNRFTWGYVFAAIAASVTGIAIWRKLQVQMVRTDLAFSHACVVPLGMAAIFATIIRNPKDVVYDLAALILAAALVVADRLFFRNYGDALLRRPLHDGLGGAPLEVLNQIQTMLEPDWEKLRGYYVTLDPLYKHASARIDAGSGPVTDDSGDAAPKDADAPNLDDTGVP